VGRRKPLELEPERPEVFAKDGEGDDLEVFPASSQVLTQVLFDKLPPFTDLLLWEAASRFQPLNHGSPLFCRVPERGNEFLMEPFQIAKRYAFEERRTESVKILFEDKKTPRTESSVNVRRVELAVQEFTTQLAEAGFDLLRGNPGKWLPGTHCGDLGGENGNSDTQHGSPPCMAPEKLDKRFRRRLFPLLGHVSSAPWFSRFSQVHDQPTAILGVPPRPQ
jgi:hypothetical protein